MQAKCSVVYFPKSSKTPHRKTVRPAEIVIRRLRAYREDWPWFGVPLPDPRGVPPPPKPKPEPKPPVAGAAR
jgi:hypothetical protein